MSSSAPLAKKGGFSGVINMQSDYKNKVNSICHNQCAQASKRSHRIAVKQTDRLDDISPDANVAGNNNLSIPS